MNEVNFHLVDGSKLTITLKTLDDVDSLTDLLKYTIQLIGKTFYSLKYAE